MCRKSKIAAKMEEEMENNKGFTLIELLLSVALLALVIGMSTDIIMTLVRTNTKTQVVNEVEQVTNFLSLKLQNDIKNSLFAEISPGGTILTLTKVNGDEIIYTVDSATGQITWNLTGSGLGDLRLTDVDGNKGVMVSCISGSQCFEIEGGGHLPTRVKTNLEFSQRNLAGTIFDSSVYLDDTFTLRGSY